MSEVDTHPIQLLSHSKAVVGLWQWCKHPRMLFPLPLLPRPDGVVLLLDAGRLHSLGPCTSGLLALHGADRSAQHVLRIDNLRKWWQTLQLQSLMTKASQQKPITYHSMVSLPR